MTATTAFSGNWNYPTHVRFGPGRIRELAGVCKGLGIKRPLLVTDPGLAALPMIDEALAANAEAGVPTTLFCDVRPNPVARNVDSGLLAYTLGGHDGIVAWGGGSAMDIGKAIALMVGQRRPIWDFEDIGDNWTRADPSGIAPIIAVPTTSGTGSEVGRAAVVAQEDPTGGPHSKKIIFHPKMMPSAVICDPELVTGLPANITAWTGMDALAHCLEAYVAPSYHPMADGVALEGLRLIGEYLPRAFADGGDVEARAHMMAAAAMGATAFQKGLGAIHSLSHPVGSIYDTHHGMTNAVFTPYVLIHNRKAIADKMTRLARFMGLKRPGFKAVLDWTLELRETFRIPHSPAELGVEPDRLKELADMAAADPTAPTNPVPVDAKAMLKMYKRAMAGQV